MDKSEKERCVKHHLWYPLPKGHRLYWKFAVVLMGWDEHTVMHRKWFYNILDHAGLTLVRDIENECWTKVMRKKKRGNSIFMSYIDCEELK